MALIFTFIVFLPALTSPSIKVLRILSQANGLIQDGPTPLSCPARCLACVVFWQLHPIHGGDPGKIAVCICEYAGVAGAVADLVVEDVDRVAGLGHREGTREGVPLCSVYGDWSQCTTSRVSEDETAAFAWISIALSACGVEGGGIHPFWVFARCLLNLKGKFGLNAWLPKLPFMYHLTSTVLRVRYSFSYDSMLVVESL